MNALRVAVGVLLLLNAGVAIWKWSVGGGASESEAEGTGTEPDRSAPAVIDGPADWQARRNATGCFTMGPFPDTTAQRRMLDRLRGRADRGRPRQTRARQWRGWWVYLPAVADREAAMAQTTRLAEAGMRDYFIVTTGRHENRVSLGLFRSRANALARRERLRSRGFEAELGPRYEYEPRYWVDYRADESTDAVWRYVSQAQPDAFRVPIPCPDEPLWPALDTVGSTTAPEPAAQADSSQ